MPWVPGRSGWGWFPPQTKFQAPSKTLTLLRPETVSSLSWELPVFPEPDQGAL